jgi:pilus assembly protein CpaE
MSALTSITGHETLGRRRLAITGDGDCVAALAIAAAALGWDAFEPAPDGIGTAAVAIEHGAPPALLVVDLDGEAEPLAALAGLAQVCLAETRVLAIGSADDVRLFRALLAAGVSDYLVKPLEAGALAAALQQIAAEAPDAAVAAGAATGRLVAVLGVRGGSGATTVASSLAWAIAEGGAIADAGANTEPGLEPERSILVDFDLHYGSAAFAFGLEPGDGLAAMLASPDRLDEQLIAATLQPAAARLGVIAAATSLEQDATISPDAAAALLKALRTTAQWVVADLPRGLDSMTRHVLRTADQVILVAPPSLEGLRDAGRLLSYLQALRAGAGPMIVVNGAVGGAAEIGRGLFEATLGQGLTAWIPALAGPAAAAAAHAMPLGAVAGVGGVNPFVALAGVVTGRTPPPTRSRLSNWWPWR